MKAVALPVLMLVLGAAPFAHGADGVVQLGPWRAWLESPGGELPFQMQLVEDGDGIGAEIANGRERIEWPDVTVQGTEIVIRIPHYDAEIRATISGEGGAGRLDGTWSRTARDGGKVEMPFHAVEGVAHRFAVKAPPADGVNIVGRWVVTMAESGGAETTVAVFEPGAGPGAVMGTFMSPTGDLGQLDGAIDGRTVRLSTFDGSHAFLLTAQVSDDGTMAGDFYSGPKYHETWTARRDDSATVTDGFSDVTWDPAVDLWAMEYTDSTGEKVTLEKVLGGRFGTVIEVMGTWCPNCHDATRMVEEIRDGMGASASKVKVVSLAFEYTNDPARSLRQIEAYKARFGITDPILLAGVAKKEEVVRMLPGLSEMKSFPTTIFLKADGTVVAVHSGFAGPATGEEHEKLKKRYVELMGELAGE